MGVKARIRWSGFAGVAALVAVTLLNWAVHWPGWVQAVLLAVGLAGMGLLVLAWGLLGREVLRAGKPDRAAVETGHGTVKPRRVTLKLDRGAEKPGPATAKLRGSAEKPGPVTARLRDGAARPGPATARLRGSAEEPGPVTAKLPGRAAEPDPVTARLRDGAEKSGPATARLRGSAEKSGPATAKPRGSAEKPDPATAKPRNGRGKPSPATAELRRTTAKSGSVTAKLRGVTRRPSSWRRLRERVEASPTSGEPVSASWLRRTLAIWVAPLLAAPPLFSGDVYSYLAQGETAARGLDPYALGPAQALGSASDVVQRVSGFWRDTPSPYGPLFTVMQRGIAGVVGDSPVLGVLAYRVLAVIGLLLIVWALPRLARTTGVSASKALWLGALNPLVLWHFVAGVHNDSLMLGLMLVGTVVALGAVAGEKLDPAGLVAGLLVIALGAEVKLPALVAFAVVGVALAKRYRGGVPRLVLIAAGMVAGFAGVSIVVSLLGGTGFGWTHTFGTSSAVDSWMAPTNWFGFLVGGYGAIFGAHMLQPMIGVGRFIGSLFALAGVGYLVRRQLTTRTTAVAALGGMLAVIVLCGPVVQPWYLPWAAVPLAAALRDERLFGAVAGLSAAFAVLLPPLGTHDVVLLVLGYAGGLVLLGAAAYRFTRPATERRLEGVAA